ncbi:MAG: hypothetical protein GY763_08440 [Gammaproteobacteria bacterium]|nr:hypothetical protein [Gammaproteobacteria bacterium]
MLQHQILLEPASTKRVMATLGLAIEETMLARRISALSDNLYRIQNLPEQRDRARFLRQELLIMEESLIDIRAKAQTD